MDVAESNDASSSSPYSQTLILDGQASTYGEQEENTEALLASPQPRSRLGMNYTAHSPPLAPDIEGQPDVAGGESQTASRPASIPISRPSTGMHMDSRPATGSTRPATSNLRPNTGDSGQTLPVPDYLVEHAEMPPEIQDLLKRRGLDKEVEAQHKRWSRIKVAILSWFCSKLREEMNKVKEENMYLKTEMLRIDAAYMEEAIAREQELLEALRMDQVLRPMQKAVRQAMQDVMDIKGEITQSQLQVNKLERMLEVIGERYSLLNLKFSCRVDEVVQTSSGINGMWVDFVRRLPPVQVKLSSPMSLSAVVEAIVRIYLRRLNDVEQYIGAVSSASVDPWTLYAKLPLDCIFDTIMQHYNSQRSPGAFSKEYLEDMEGPIARLLRSCQLYHNELKVRMFLYFTGCTDPDSMRD